MKTAETKTTTSNLQPKKQQGHTPFFQKDGQGSFFSSEKATAKPFFSPSTIQPKLTIGQPNDKYEREADSMADKVVQRLSSGKTAETAVNMPAVSSSNIQTKSSTNSEEEQLQKKEGEEDMLNTKLEIQTKPIFESGEPPPEENSVQRMCAESGQAEHISPKAVDAPATASPGLQSNLNRTKGGGSPLADNTRTSMEGAFDSDFSNVRVHTDSSAVQMNKELGAQAFTHGSDVYFNEGKYSPTTGSGQHLLAHELTHTVQQGATNSSVQKKEDKTLSKELNAPKKVTSLAQGIFNPSKEIADYIDNSGKKGTSIRVKIGGFASGLIEVKKSKESYKTKNAQQAIPVHIPFLNPLQQKGFAPLLIIRINDNIVTGYLTIGKIGKKPKQNRKALFSWIENNPVLMNWYGIKTKGAPKITNKLENGNLNYRADGVKAKFGGFLDGDFNLGISDSSVDVEGKAKMNIKNISEGELNFKREKDGNLKGQGDFGVNIKQFNGAVHADFFNGILDIKGKAKYTTEKLEGDVNIIIADAKKADSIAQEQIAPQEMNDEAVQDAGLGKELAVPKVGNRAMAGWGELNFSFNDWLVGKALVVMDSKGQVTVIGEIAPPAEVELFKGMHYRSPNFVDIHPTFRYGFPYIADVHVGLDFLLYAKAQVGPALLRNIIVQGQYSTDPTKFNEFSLSANLHIPAEAGLVLSFGIHGGVGILLVDFNFGGEITGEAGIKAYLDATPTIGYREVADPAAGKKGEFFIKGQAELAAQPYLGLGGNVYLEVDPPWPFSDKRWTWPVFNKEYPLPGEFGVQMNMGDYVLGSGETPEFDMQEVKFDHDKFAEDVLDENLPAESSGGKSRKGFKDELAVEKPKAAANEANAGSNKETLPSVDSTKKKTKKKKNKTPNKDAGKNYYAALKKIGKLQEKATSKPLDERSLKTKLSKIERKHKPVRISSMPAGQTWKIIASVPNLSNHDAPIFINGIITPTTEKNEIETPGVNDKNTESIENSQEEKDKLNIEKLYPLIGLERPVKVDGGHSLILEGTINHVIPNVYSRKKSLNSLLNEKRENIYEEQNQGNDVSERLQAINRLFSEKKKLGKQISKYRAATKTIYSGGKISDVKSSHQKIGRSLDQITKDLGIVGIDIQKTKLPPTQVTFTSENGRAKKIEAAPLTRVPGNSNGSKPTRSPKGWELISPEDRGRGRWVRAHLLSHQLHGPGIPENLFPGTRAMNLDNMETKMERNAKKLVWENGKTLYYTVSLTYGNSGQFADIPTRVSMEYGEYRPDTGKKKKMKWRGFAQEAPGAVYLVDVNQDSASRLNQVAITNGMTGMGNFFGRLVHERGKNGKFSDLDDIETRMKQIYKNENIVLSHIGHLDTLIDENKMFLNS